MACGRPLRSAARPHDADDTDNLLHTTDFRRVYAAAIDGWIAPGFAPGVLGGTFDPLPLFATG